MLLSNYYLLLCPKRFHFSNWNVAGVLWSATLHHRYRFYRWGGKNWGTPSQALNEPSDPKRAVFVMQIGEQSGAACTQSEVRCKRRHFCRDFLHPGPERKLVQFCFFLTVLFFCFFARSPTGDKRISLFCWWFGVHRDSFLFTVSNLMAHLCRGNKSMQLSARCSWPCCTVCMKFREVVVVHLNVSGRHWAS